MSVFASLVLLTAFMTVSSGGVRYHTQRRALFDALVRGRLPGAYRADGDIRIIGGESAAVGQFPWQGNLGDKFSASFCGLSILSENFVVTAAHCMIFADFPTLTVKVGITNLKDTSGQEVGVRAYYKHEDYNLRHVNDIAILELAQPLEWNDNVQPIAIGVGRTPLPDENGCVISGWGRTDPHSNSYPEDLQFLDVTFYDDATCSQIWARRGYKSDMHLCAGTPSGNNACFGDSGGPLVCKTAEEGPCGNSYLFGATSYGNGHPCGQYRWPTVFTDTLLSGLKIKLAPSLARNHGRLSPS